MKAEHSSYQHGSSSSRQQNSDDESTPSVRARHMPTCQPDSRLHQRWWAWCAGSEEFDAASTAMLLAWAHQATAVPPVWGTSPVSCSFYWVL